MNEVYKVHRNYYGDIGIGGVYLMHWRPKGSRNGYTTMKNYTPIGERAQFKWVNGKKVYLSGAYGYTDSGRENRVTAMPAQNNTGAKRGYRDSGNHSSHGSHAGGYTYTGQKPSGGVSGSHDGQYYDLNGNPIKNPVHPNSSAYDTLHGGSPSDMADWAKYLADSYNYEFTNKYDTPEDAEKERDRRAEQKMILDAIDTAKQMRSDLLDYANDLADEDIAAHIDDDEYLKENHPWYYARKVDRERRDQAAQDFVDSYSSASGSNPGEKLAYMAGKAVVEAFTAHSDEDKRRLSELGLDGKGVLLIRTPGGPGEKRKETK